MNANQIKENIKIEFFLKSMGFDPVKINENKNEYWYYSPFREEKKSSFKVNIKNQTWKDFGNGYGGSIIDFVMYYQKLNFKETISYFNDKYKNFDNSKFTLNLDKIKKVFSKNIEIISISKLQKKYLFSYIYERKIDLEIAKKYCKEILYKVHYEDGVSKSYYGIGFKNNDGGYEIRNKYFKGNGSIKNVTMINNCSNILKAFEGFFDFLSFLTENKDLEFKFNYLILNSTSYLKFLDPKKEDFKSGFLRLEEQFLFKILHSHEEIHHYFDNDKTGKECKEIIKKLHKKTIDKSHLYEAFEDYNDMLIKRN